MTSRKPFTSRSKSDKLIDAVGKTLPDVTRQIFACCSAGHYPGCTRRRVVYICAAGQQILAGAGTNRASRER